MGAIDIWTFGSPYGAIHYTDATSSYLSCNTEQWCAGIAYTNLNNGVTAQLAVELFLSPSVTPRPLTVFEYFFTTQGFDSLYGRGGPVAVDAPTVAVPGPIVGAGLPGLVMALCGLLAWRRRRNQAAVA